ncbi:MAG: hypothetical protein CMQ46_11660 [Gammaproteobacteria bacterium]|nr:hypothetical protein [Gammaproteobacteria bacterium]MBJ55903.1 hypothetical protein [Gammaproteobacteria bacterium]HBN15297.1 hypothetical protein [Pseudohongiella sp.]|tara:strand:+ start:1178 stop:1732 length:555 start_codon:yes stop_codon:yes gene_type:complete
MDESIYKMIGILLVLVLPSLSYGGEIEDMHPTLERSREAYREIFESSRSYEAANSKDHGVEVIGIERRSTFGSGPAYTLIIKSDGTFRYVGHGGLGVAKLGSLTGTIPEWLFDRLSHYIVDLDYMSLSSYYQVGATDQALVYTMVVSQGTRKTIQNHGNAGPTGLWALQQAIENTLRYAVWNEE